MTSISISLNISAPMMTHVVFASTLLIVLSSAPINAQNKISAQEKTESNNAVLVKSTGTIESITLDKLLSLVRNEAVELKSIDLELKALDAEINARDLVLATTVELNVEALNDERESTSTTPTLESKTYDLSLTLPLATGTKIIAATDLNQSTLKNATPDERNTSAWAISIEQNLWKDFLGHGTRMRRAFDNAEMNARKYELIFKKQNILVMIENAYWDLVSATKEFNIRKENLRRSEQMLTWVKGRLNRSAADKKDVLQVEALVKSRQLQMSSLENNIESAWLMIQQNLPRLTNRASWVPDVRELETDRDLNLLFYKSKDDGRLMSLQSLTAHYRAKQAQAKAYQIADSVRPELKLYATYGANSIDEDRQTSIDELQSDPNNYTQVGVNFKTNLDFWLERDLKASARALAEISQMQSELKKQQSVLGWSDLQREIKSLRTQAALAKELSDIQLKKGLEERRSYQQGKATLFQAVSFEVEASEAELGALKALAQLRKAEAQARLFAKEEI